MGQTVRTLQVWILPCQEADHGLQLAELSVGRIDIRDAVDPGNQGNPHLLKQFCHASSHSLLLVCGDFPTYQSLARVRSGWRRSCRPETRAHTQYGVLMHWCEDVHLNGLEITAKKLLQGRAGLILPGSQLRVGAQP